MRVLSLAGGVGLWSLLLSQHVYGSGFLWYNDKQKRESCSYPLHRRQQELCCCQPLGSLYLKEEKSSPGAVTAPGGMAWYPPTNGNRASSSWKTHAH